MKELPKHKPPGLAPEATETEEERRGHRWALLLLVGIGLLGGGTWAFMEIADEVSEGETHVFDRQILLSMRVEGDIRDPLGPDWLEEMVRDFTALGGVGVLTLLTLAVISYLVLMKNYRSAALVAAAIGTGIIGSTLLKAGFDRPRPDLVPHGSHISSSSFPSGHSMMSALVYFTLGLMLAAVQRLGRLRVFIVVMAILLTMLVGASRVYLGVHWPTDVFAGWLAGAVWAISVWSLARWARCC